MFESLKKMKKPSFYVFEQRNPMFYFLKTFFHDHLFGILKLKFFKIQLKLILHDWNFLKIESYVVLKLNGFRNLEIWDIPSGITQRWVCLYPKLVSVVRDVVGCL